MNLPPCFNIRSLNPLPGGFICDDYCFGFSQNSLFVTAHIAGFNPWRALPDYIIENSLL